MERLSQLRAFALQDPDNDRIVLDIVDELLARGMTVEAFETLEGVSGDWRERPDFMWRIGRCALSSGRFADAVATLETLLSRGNDTVAIRHDLAFSLLCDRRLDAAEKVLAPVLPQSVAVPSVGILHARILQHRRQLDDAALIVQAIVNEHPEHAEAWGLLALVYVDLVQADAGKEAADTALRLQPGQPDALTALGTLALWARDAEGAYRSFADILAFQPEAGRALAGAGESFMLRGDIPAARAFLARAVERMPNHVGTWHALAWCELLEGDSAQARTCFEKAFELDRNFGETHGGFAVISALGGDYDEAHQWIKKALRLDPHSRNARYAQSVLWTAEGRGREAAAMVDGILADTGLDPARRGAGFIEQLQARLRLPKDN
jgi:Flp pilus assembly protein TadD